MASALGQEPPIRRLDGTCACAPGDKERACRWSTWNWRCRTGTVSDFRLSASVCAPNRSMLTSLAWHPGSSVGRPGTAPSAPGIEHAHRRRVCRTQVRRRATSVASRLSSTLRSGTGVAASAYLPHESASLRCSRLEPLSISRGVILVHHGSLYVGGGGIASIAAARLVADVSDGAVAVGHGWPIALEIAPATMRERQEEWMPTERSRLCRMPSAPDTSRFRWPEERLLPPPCPWFATNCR